jgi:N-methylhydantoinase A
VRRAADLRYLHQGYELIVEIPDGPLTPATLRAIEDAFHREHRRLYSYDLRGQTVELVNLRVTATGLLPHTAGVPAAGMAQRTSAPLTPHGARDIYFGSETRWRLVPCYSREQLPAATALEGPLAIDQDDSTTVLWPGQSARVDERGNLLVSVPRLDAPD